MPHPPSAKPVTLLLPPSAAATCASHLTTLINLAYQSEASMWKIENKQRTTIAGLSAIIEKSEIIVAYIPPFTTPPSSTLPFVPEPSTILGCIQTLPPSSNIYSFGMLAVASSAQGSGVGRLLVEAAERKAQKEGFSEMQLEILMPTEWKSLDKEKLKGWYERMGYAVVEVRDFGDFYPEMVPLLACKVKYVIFRKGL